MERRRESNVDWFGRLLGCLGILVGGGASAYFYTQNEARKSDIAAAVADLSERLGKSTSEADQFNDDWNKQLTDALQEFKQRANDALVKNADAQTARDALFREELAKLTAAGPDLEAAVEKKYKELQAQLAAPHLRVAQTLMKPMSESDAGVIMVKNDGDHEASLRSVTFTPKSQIEILTTPRIEAGLQSASWLVIRFQEEHNTARSAGRHAAYKRVFVEPAFVPGNSYIRVRVEIENSTHLGWGFVGDLSLEYEDSKTLDIPNVRVSFVAATEDST